MLAQDYYNQIGAKKDFEDPLYLEKIAPHISKDAKIVEYGCGYGRLLRLLKKSGYTHLVGFDFSKSMIDRGRRENPDIDLSVTENRKIPLKSESTDMVLISTILTSMIHKDDQKALIAEILRILKPGGILYLSDFLICDHPRYQEKYIQGQKQFGEWGIYTTSENLTVRHHTSRWILDLLSPFDLQWFEQFDFKTMNNNPARTIHCIGKKV
ncbi:MAG: class I SAM-dependent methyltransferase [Parachlamydiales bacterium]|nr:class I SAM-dependent methyltransferase [Parachlamydiales bacterium]